jgi:hypothetical protein
MSDEKKCPKGKILRQGYVREASSGRPANYVKSSCVKDMGKPGKGPKTLPPIGDDLHLSKYGYKVHASSKQRRIALTNAMKDVGILPVLRHLNLIRNYQSDPVIKGAMTKDVEFLKQTYKMFKVQLNELRGGGVPIETIMVINQKQYTFDTLKPDSIEQLLASYIALPIVTGKKMSADDIRQGLGNGSIHCICVKCDDVICGYCLYRDLADNKVYICDMSIKHTLDPNKKTTQECRLLEYFYKHFEDIVVDKNCECIDHDVCKFDRSTACILNFWCDKKYNFSQVKSTESNTECTVLCMHKIIV